MKIRRWRIGVVMGMLAVCGRPAAGEPHAASNSTLPNDTNRRIDDALKKGVDYLLTQKTHDHWEDTAQTGLRLYALLQVGRSIDDPRLRSDSAELAPAVRWLAAQEPRNPSGCLFKVLALTAASPTAELKTAIARACDTLVRFAAADGSVAAGTHVAWNTMEICWTYAALAAAEDSGVEVNPKLWQAADTWWRARQQKDGGWPGGAGTAPGTPGDTAAGLWALYVAGAKSPPPPALPATAAGDPAAESALTKLVADFEPRSADHLYLYQFECAASAAGLQWVNGVDWYQAASDQILKAQRADGSWPASGAANVFTDSEGLQTALALLFLARGRDPVLFDKLQYGDAGGESHWNDRPRDDANLTAFVARQFDKHFNWQIVSLEAPARDWPNAPILLITGSGDPGFSPEDVAKLRRFVEQGGLIFSSADGADAVFTDAISRKYAPLLAENRYAMRPLPASHEIFSGELFSRIAAPPALLGLSNGVREWWIHSPADMGASWQLRKSAAREHFLLPANLVRYATGNGTLANKLQAAATPAEAATSRAERTIHLARLEYAGNFDPEPGAWPRFAALAPARFHSRLEITTVKLLDLNFARTQVADITGTDSFAASEAELAALRKFLDAGGTLLADSAGGSTAFTASFHELVSKLYPDAAPADLAVNDPVLNGSIADSVRLAEVEYRKYAVLKMKDRPVKPHLEAVTIHGRHVILFSPEDITSGLAGVQTWGIRGYTPESSENLAGNMLLYAVTR